jgi:hypothetical protein
LRWLIRECQATILLGNIFHLTIELYSSGVGLSTSDGILNSRSVFVSEPYLFHNFTEKLSNMTTIVINEKTKKGRIILDLIREMGIGEIIEKKRDQGMFRTILT